MMNSQHGIYRACLCCSVLKDRNWSNIHSHPHQEEVVSSRLSVTNSLWHLPKHRICWMTSLNGTMPPTTQDDKDLFTLKQKYLFSIFIVRYQQQLWTFDASIFVELHNYHTISTQSDHGNHAVHHQLLSWKTTLEREDDCVFHCILRATTLTI